MTPIGDKTVREVLIADAKAHLGVGVTVEGTPDPVPFCWPCAEVELVGTAIANGRPIYGEDAAGVVCGHCDRPLSRRNNL